MFGKFIYILIFSPLIIAAITFLPYFGDEGRTIRRIVKNFSTAYFALCVTLSLFFDFATPGFSIDTACPWVNIGGINADFSLNALSLLLIDLISFIFFLAVFLGKTSINKKQKTFYSLLLTILSFTSGAIASNDMFVTTAFLQLTVFSTFILINKFSYGNRNKNAMKYATVQTIGNICLFTAFAVMYSLNFAYNGILSSNINDTNTILFPDIIACLLYLAIFAGFCTKIPFIGFNPGYDEIVSRTPGPIALIISSIIPLTGFYGILKFNVYVLSQESANFSEPFVIIAAAGIIYSLISVLRQKDIKRIFAHITCINASIAIIGISSLNISSLSGAILQILFSTLSACGLIILSAVLYEKTGTSNIERIKGSGRKMPVFTLLSVPLLAASCFMPFIGDFIPVFLCFSGVLSYFYGSGSFVFIVIIILSVLIQTMLFVSMTQFIQKTFFSPIIYTSRKIKDISAYNMFILFPVIISLLFIGIFPSFSIDIINVIIDDIRGAF